MSLPPPASLPPLPPDSPELDRLRKLGVRPLSVAGRLCFLAFAIMAMVVLLEGEALGDGLERWASSLTKSRELLQLASATGELLAWLPLLLTIPVLFSLQAHYGGAEWGPWGVRVVDIFSGQRGTHLPWQQVESLKEISGGLRVVPGPSAGKLFRLAGPSLIVAPGEERERLLAATAPFVGQHFQPEVFGGGPSRTEWGLLWGLVGLYLPVAVWVCMEGTESGWGQAAQGLSLTCILIGALACCVCGYLALTGRSIQVELYEAEGYPTLLRLDRTAVPLEEIEGVAREGGAFWVQGARHSSGLARIHDPAQAEALAATFARLGVEVREGLPWTRRPRLRIPLFWAGALLGLLIGFAPALWAAAVPARKAARLSDEHGQDVLLVWEQRSHRPLALVALPPQVSLEVRGLRGAYGLSERHGWGREPTFLIDVEAMTWSDRSSASSGSLSAVASASVAAASSQVRVVSWGGPEGLAGLEGRFRDAELGLTVESILTTFAFFKARTFSGRTTRERPSLPASLSQHLRPEPGPLADYLSGETSRRVHDLRGVTPDKDLVAGVARGRVLWAALIPRDSSQTLSGGGVGYEIGKGGNLVTLSPGLWRIHVGGAQSLVRATPPTLAELRELEARLAAGAPEGEELLEPYSR